MHNKLLISGRWVFCEDDKWRFAIDPFIEIYNIEANTLKTVSAFSIVDIAKYQCERKFNRHGVTVNDEGNLDAKLTLTNLGDYSDSDGFPYQFFLITEPANVVKDRMTAGYEIFVDEIELDEDEDELDHTIVRLLKRLTAPTSITCSVNKNETYSA